MTAEQAETFDEFESTAIYADDQALLVHVDGFEGPLDLLLTLARNQKVDIAKISILSWPTNIWNSTNPPRNCIWNWRPTIW